MKNREASRKRAYAPKVKSGCRTCKVRRIKCGEEKPFCSRCVDTGRKCDGYPTNTQVVRGQVKIQPKLCQSLSTIVGDGRDEASLNIFAQDTAPKISGFYDQNFWSRIVTQLGHNEPAIRLAVQAVNAVHEQTERTGGNTRSQQDPRTFHHYNNAIAQVVSSPSSHNRYHVNLIVIALFICLEFLLNDEEKAATHINGGLRILDDWYRNCKSRSNSPGTPGSSTSSTSSNLTSSESEVMDEMTGMFARLEVHSKVFGKQMHNLTYTSEYERDFAARYYTNLNDARDEGFRLMSDAIGFIAKGTPLAYRNHQQDEATLIEQTNLRDNLLDWRRAYEDFAQREHGNLSHSQIRAGNMIHCLILSSFIWTNTCLSPYEKDYDNYKDEFAKIIELAKTIIDIPTENLCNNIRRFQFDMGLIPSLHLVGIRCRVPAIRDACVKLLSTHHWREGLFDSVRSARFIKNCIEVEESNNHELLGLKSYERANYLLDEGARIHFVGMEAGDREDGTKLHSFYSKPYGAFGDWYVQEVYLPVSPQVLTREPRAIGKPRVLPNSAYTMPNIYSKTYDEKTNENKIPSQLRNELPAWPRIFQEIRFSLG